MTTPGTTNLQTTPYLPRQRNFPKDDAQVLSVELDKTYIEIASRMNERTIGIYANNFPIVTGNKWYLTGGNRIQQTLRQVYPITSTAPVAHGINFAQISGFVQLYGTYTDGTNWYGLIAGSNTAIAGQISFYLTPTNITFLSGGGAPTLTKGFVVLEWLSTVATNT